MAARRAPFRGSLASPRRGSTRAKGTRMLPSANLDAPRAPQAPWADLLAALNRDKPDQAKINHAATIPFGPTMRVERFVLGNGLEVLALVDPVAPVACVQTWF